MTKRIWAAFLCLGVMGCQTTTAPRQKDQFLLEADEARIWERSRESIDLLHKAGYVVDDPELVAYLEGICKRLYPQVDDHPSEFEVLVLKDPAVNAFVYPNGVTCIYTGLLAAMESEAQLAMVLGHELAHFHQRHAVEGWRHLKSQAAFHQVLGVGTLGYGYLYSMIGFPAAISGHSRENEAEADELGWKWFVDAGYAKEEAAFAFERLKEYAAENKEKEPYFFGSHPHLQDRIEAMHALSASLSSGGADDGGVVGSLSLFEPLKRVLVTNAFLDLDIGNFNRVEKMLSRFEAQGQGVDDPEFLYAKADTLLRRGGDGDESLALGLCEHGLAIEPQHPGLNRVIGQLYHRRGEWGSAAQALRTAITLDPEYPRNPFLIHYLRQCEEKLSSSSQ